MEACTGDGAKLSWEVHNGRTRDNRHKQEHRKFQLGIKKRFYTTEKYPELELHSKEIVESMSLEISKLDRTTAQEIQSHWSPFEQELGLGGFYASVLAWSF